MYVYILFYFTYQETVVPVQLVFRVSRFSVFFPVFVLRCLFVEHIIQNLIKFLQFLRILRL